MVQVVLCQVQLPLLSCGKPINKSCELAIKYVNQSLKTKINYGKGHGPVNHLNSFTLENKFK